MKLDKNKIEQALLRAGCSNRRSKEIAIVLVGEDLLIDEPIRKIETKKIQEVVEEVNKNEVY